VSTGTAWTTRPHRVGQTLAIVPKTETHALYKMDSILSTILWCVVSRPCCSLLNRSFLECLTRHRPSALCCRFEQGYSDDDCVDHFTEGQAVRMAALWNAYRSTEVPKNDTVPKNDYVCQAATAAVGLTPYTNVMAEAQDGEPVPPGTDCEDQNGWCETSIQNSVWYTIVAPASGCINIGINNAIGFLDGSDMQLALYSVGECDDFGTFELVAANDDGGFGCAPLIRSAFVVPGETYYIQLDGYDGTIGSGNLEITSECIEAPTNDNVCQAATAAVGLTPYTNVMAGAQDGEPVPPGTDCEDQNGWCETSIQNSVWYTIVAPASGCINIGIGALDDTDLQLALYSVGECDDFESFDLVASNDDGGLEAAPLIQLAFVVPSETYYIQLDGYEGTIGTGQLEITACCTEPEIVCGDSKNGVDKKAAMCVWDSKKGQHKTKCVDPAKGFKPNEDKWLVGCGCCANDDEKDPPQYCTNGTKATTNATKKPYLNNKTPPAR
jgi:hypothetical protein